MIAGIGMILKKLCTTTGAAQVILATDKKIEDCLEKLHESAKEKAKSNKYCMDDNEAEKIIKEFYGITNDTLKSDKVVSLFDFM